MKVSHIFSFIFLSSIFVKPMIVYAEKDKIIWMKIDAPPYYISKGIYKGEGIADKVIDILKKNYQIIIMKNFKMFLFPELF